jgi:hypothetical protein
MPKMKLPIHIKKANLLTLILLLFANTLILDTILALAGRDVLVVKYIPGMSFFFVVMLFSFGILLYFYIFFKFISEKNWFLLIFILMIFFSELMGGFFMYKHMCGKSSEEARKIVSDFLQSPQNYAVSYEENTELGLVTEIGAEKKDILPVYAFHPHGRYLFIIKSNEKERFFVQLNRGIEKNELFVMALTRFPEFRLP